jgi:hypothetical protein
MQIQELITKSFQDCIVSDRNILNANINYEVVSGFYSSRYKYSKNGGNIL